MSNIAVSKEDYETGVLDEAKAIKVEPILEQPPKLEETIHAPVVVAKNTRTAMASLSVLYFQLI